MPESDPETVVTDQSAPAKPLPVTTLPAGVQPGDVPQVAVGAECSTLPTYFFTSLEDAERLLAYAAEMGVSIDDKTRRSVLDARAAACGGCSQEIVANLLAALTVLAATLDPVSAESLRNFDAGPNVRTYWIVAICLVIIIVPFSLASFITSALTNTIRTDITSANDLAVKLTAQFGAFAQQTPAVPAPPGANAGMAALPAGISPADAITELQTFSSQIRAIYARSRQLDEWFLFGSVRDPFSDVLKNGEYKKTFQLPVPLPTQLGPVVSDRVSVFQDARYFGQESVDDVSVFYGAATTCLLPVLYALLGTCAYLLRSFQKEVRLRTFVPSRSHSARFLIAAIVGSVVGLFNNFTVGQGASIPPLAIAFVVGYAVDVFFVFLEGLIQAFTKGKSGSNPALPASKA